MGQLIEPNASGDTKIIWDPEKEEEVEVARNAFDKLKKKGYYAYKVKADGKKGVVTHTFDPKAEKIIMALPMRGG